VDTAGTEPAASAGTTLGLGPEMALEVLAGLQRDADQLGDDTLARAVSAYRTQVTRVLALHGISPGELAAKASAAPNGKAATPPTPVTSQKKPEAAPKAADDPKPAATKEIRTGRRRRQ
jgi:hypothetical protein